MKASQTRLVGHPKIVVFAYSSQSPPSTFVQRHIDDIGGGDGNFMQLHEWSTPMLGGRPLWNTGLAGRFWRKLRALGGAKKEDLHREAFGRALKQVRPAAVLVEFGYSGTHLMETCHVLGIPLVVHFHGTEINRVELFEKHRAGYQRLGKVAAALITVSELEKSKLVNIGVPESKLCVVPCGANLPDDILTYPSNLGESFNIVSTTRMSEVKAPHLVILAFKKFLELGGDGTLQMIGDGELLPFCQSLARGLGISGKCVFHGRLPHEKVAQLLSSAHMYVQHSVVARDGDCEGMPVSLMEAASYGLPIVTTGVGGIPEYFSNGINAHIVNEYDTSAMGSRMYEIFSEVEQAKTMGMSARQLALKCFNAKEQSEKIKRLIEGLIN